MLTSPLLGFLVQLFQVGVELTSVDPPDAPAADLDRRKGPRPDQRVDLGNTDAEIGRNILEGHEARLDIRRSALSGLCALGRTLRGRHTLTIALGAIRYLDLTLFAPVWRAS